MAPVLHRHFGTDDRVDTGPFGSADEAHDTV